MAGAQHAARVLTGSQGAPRSIFSPATGSSSSGTSSSGPTVALTAGRRLRFPPAQERPYERTEGALGWLPPLCRCRVTEGRAPPRTESSPKRGASAAGSRHRLRRVYARVCGATQDASDGANSFNNSY